ncbi:hypothetical protein TI39_contig4128g00014 [Zymoseptoria brevis]|uniref:Uncharacterized protein n=1 Tax=Zymoseptoria brevis TaxID=1047168 RepID=A0A0F4GG73_9PEZI|nr:hypothetical protein TI39_contig4128g00014 [Zymoseptoria brevis]
MTNGDDTVSYTTCPQQSAYVKDEDIGELVFVEHQDVTAEEADAATKKADADTKSTEQAGNDAYPLIKNLKSEQVVAIVHNACNRLNKYGPSHEPMGRFFGGGGDCTHRTTCRSSKKEHQMIEAHDVDELWGGSRDEVVAEPKTLGYELDERLVSNPVGSHKGLLTTYLWSRSVRWLVLSPAPLGCSLSHHTTSREDLNDQSFELHASQYSSVVQ